MEPLVPLGVISHGFSIGEPVPTDVTWLRILPGRVEEVSVQDL